MNFWFATILGVVEGITEFLPISSTGHLILTTHLVGLSQTEFIKTFEIAIQLGAILSVVVLYWKSLLVDFEVLSRIAAAFVPTAIAGLVFYKIIKNVLLDSQQVVLWALLVGGIFLIIFELGYKEKEEPGAALASISFQKAFAIGVFQSLAMVPGVSRSAATIIGGLVLGLKRKTIVEFSFLLAVPTMLAATAWDLFQNVHDFSADQFVFLAVGFLVSFVVAILSIKFLLHFIQSHNFIVFGVYRILIALLFWFTVR